MLYEYYYISIKTEYQFVSCTVYCSGVHPASCMQYSATAVIAWCALGDGSWDTKRINNAHTVLSICYIDSLLLSLVN